MASIGEIEAQVALHVKAPRLDNLSFIVRNPGAGGGYNYWNVESTGDYGADCAKGRALGEEYLAYLGRYPTNGNATLLQCIVDGMISRTKDSGNRSGRYLTGVEIGFLAAVNRHAMTTAALMAIEPIPT